MTGLLALLAGCTALRPAPDPLAEAAALFPPPPDTLSAVVLPEVNAEAPAVTLDELPPVEIPAATLAMAAAVAAEPPVQPIGDGVASYYGHELAGRPTASGERFNPERLTAAHRTLPFGSRVRVTNLRNGESIVVRINDRGPFAHGRVIDLSQAAARAIGMIRSGTARVKLELLATE